LECNFTGSNPVLTSKKLKQIDMDFDEEKEWDRLWIKHRNAMIQALICGVILGWCIGIYC
jgi:hypothetical protein